MGVEEGTTTGTTSVEDVTTNGTALSATETVAVPHSPAYHFRALDASGSPASIAPRTASSPATPQKQALSSA